jgi:hypothetical protein
MSTFDKRAFTSWLRHTGDELVKSTLPHGRAGLLIVVLGFAACGGGGSSTSPESAALLQESSYPTAAAKEPGLTGRVIVGYQGWFGCPNDFLDNKEWHHWFGQAGDNRSLTVDLLPSVSAFNVEDLCDTGLKRDDGSPVYVFSSQNPNVVAKHFDWIKGNDIDGVAFQRFVTHTSTPHLRNRSDNVLAHVRKSAERTGRIFYVTYDISGADPNTVIDDIRRDWKYLVEQLNLTGSPAYLHQRGKPLVQLWGLGFKDRPGTAEQSRLLISDLKNGHAGMPAATVIGGVPTGWRTLTADSKEEPGWATVYRSYDVISPWSVGRYSDEAGADWFRKAYLEPDLAETRRLGLGYMPVVFPGFSWHNLMTFRNLAGDAVLDQIPRRCGNFMWRQVFNSLEARAESIYAAMFDEVDEGTALFNLDSSGRAPVGVELVSLNGDGCVQPEDWYLRITGKAAQLLRSGEAPASSLEAIGLK